MGSVYLKNTIVPADEACEGQNLFQLVRRAPRATPTEQAKTVVETVTSRENFLSKALITLLSVNIFLISGVISFCAFTFWYPN